jgi:ketosteroid isomerase-like protein
MRSTLVGIGTATALLILGPALPAHERAPQARALSPLARSAAASVDAFHAALRRGDTRSAAALLSEDALIFEAGGAEHSKTEYAEHHLPADAEFSRAVSSVVSRRAGHADGSLAWIGTEGRTTGTFRGKALDQRTTETMILRRAGGSWKIVHIHWSSAAAR